MLFPILSILRPAFALLGLTLAAHGAADLAFVGNPSVNPGSALAGGQVTVTYVVRNQGNATAVASKSRVQIFTPVSTQFSFMDFPIAALAAGQQRTETHILPLRIDSWSGTWEASVRLDTECVVDEGFATGNNASTRAPFYLTATRADLTFAVGSRAVYQEYAPNISPAAYGGSVRIGFDIKNDSTAAAPASKTRVEIRNRSNDLHIQAFVDTPSIPAGTSVPFTYVSALPATGTAGSWSVFLVLDDGPTTMTEATKFNNSSSTISFRVEAAGTALPASPAVVGLANPRIEAGQMVFELAGQPGSPVTVQTSTNLVNWSTQASPTIINGVTRHTVPLAGGPRFYRVR